MYSGMKLNDSCVVFILKKECAECVWSENEWCVHVNEKRLNPLSAAMYRSDYIISSTVGFKGGKQQMTLESFDRKDRITSN